MVHAALLFLLTIITVFGVVGVVLMVRALRDAGRETSFLEPMSSSRRTTPARPTGTGQPIVARAAEPGATTPRATGLGGRLRRLVSRTHGDVALLGPRRRVLIEFLGALCAFPGLGWILSGRVALGFTLLVGCPAVVWALLPMSLSVVGHFGLSLALRYILPVLALVSAGALAMVERGSSAPARATSTRPEAGAAAPPAAGSGAARGA
jgi:hypothetical protein